LGGVVLAERGEDASVSVFDADHVVEECVAHLLQIFDELGDVYACVCSCR
jgi:hypothetical protein